MCESPESRRESEESHSGTPDASRDAISPLTSVDSKHDCPSLEGDRSASSPIILESNLKLSHHTDIQRSSELWMSSDLEYYLKYHRTSVNYHHYLFKHDGDHFLHTSLIEQAMQYQPLLFAVAGFAAFQHTVQCGHGDISKFFGYYDRSVSLLRQSLASGVTNTEATLLTILQLATFEVNASLSHQCAKEPR